MKVTGSGPQVPTGAADEAKPAENAKGPTFADKLESTAAPTQTTSAGAGARTSSAGGKLTGDIAEALVNKEITPEAAVDQVVNRILDKQVGPGTKSATRASVETALREALESDPVLSSKVKSLAD
jgi:hypothetical protein